MKTKTLEEWIELYEKKTNLKYEDPAPRTIRFYFPDKGFAEIGVAKDMVVIGQTSGDGIFWKQVAEVLAREHGITHLGTWLVREPEPYLKFFGVEIEKVEEKEKGMKRYFGKFKDTGKKALITPQGTMKNGHIRYIVTWEI
ncbi:MAG: hypothetical protein IJS81_12835 [Selenomonadaceae bacterium]|nr:hypothetical protein [Selenomonadaceae bacterium]